MCALKAAVSEGKGDGEVAALSRQLVSLSADPPCGTASYVVKVSLLCLSLVSHSCTRHVTSLYLVRPPSCVSLVSLSCTRHVTSLYLVFSLVSFSCLSLLMCCSYLN